MEMKSIPTPSGEEEGVTIRFEDVLRFLKCHVWKILILSLAGLAFGISVTFVIPRQWEAVGVLQIGQIANEATTAPAPPTPIEPAARALERLRMPQFTNSVLKDLGQNVGLDEGATAVLIRRSLKSTILNGTDLIQFAVRGYSPEEAKRAARAIGDELSRVHAGLMRPSLDRLNADLAEVEQGVISEGKRRDALSELVKTRGQAGVAGKFSENVLLSEMVTENEKALRFLRFRKNSLHELLSKERTFNTHLLGPVEASRRYVYPSKALFGAAGLVIGLLLSLLLGIAIETRRRVKQL
ncbi:hypothetical protein [Cupriavidus sp. IDO]|uniref:hypothetical protein n=1 Tax=Cupriavidus sp. IDO TaxID=1539142 RepID=UPI00068EDE02|nr:hypothetical protein [Cupriavidus sp. IDO]KWR90151.1 hypothetical protein RM96_10675 [Cupriavidus sp. IDO]